MQFLIEHKAALPNKAPTTHCVGIGFFTCVQPLMSDQVAFMPKSFLADHAHKRPITSVQPLMVTQVLRRKAFLTGSTYIGLFASAIFHELDAFFAQSFSDTLHT